MILSQSLDDISDIISIELKVRFRSRANIIKKMLEKIRADSFS